MPHSTSPIGTDIQDGGYELRRIPLPRTPVNRGSGGALLRRLRATWLWVSGAGFGVPRQDFGAQSIQLPLSNLADEVVLLEGIVLQVVVLLLLVAEVVDVLLMPLDPGRAQ